MDMSRIFGFDFVCLPGQNHAKLLDSGTFDLKTHPYISRPGFFTPKALFRRPKCVDNRGVANICKYVYVYMLIYTQVYEVDYPHEPQRPSPPRSEAVTSAGAFLGGVLASQRLSAACLRNSRGRAD